MKKDYELPEAEYRFMDIVWENEPLLSRQLADLGAQIIGWTHSTSYTVLRRLTQRGILVNEKSQVRSLVPREEVRRLESQREIERKFGGSLKAFVAAYYGDKKIPAEEACELKSLIDGLTAGN